MMGFLGIICKPGNLPKLSKMELFPLKITSTRHVRQVIKGKKYLFLRDSIDKFLEDKLFEEDSRYVVSIDGVLLNRKFLINVNPGRKLKDLLIGNLVEIFRGEFAGFVYDKINDEIMIFTDHISSKPVFYHINDKFIAFSTNYSWLLFALKILGSRHKLDEIGAYSLIEFGHMLEDKTIVQGVSKIPPGSILKINLRDNIVSLKRYFEIKTSNYYSDKSKLLKDMWEIFSEAVRLEWEKDKEYNYRHLASISGGLDARTNVITAWKLGFKNITTLTFTESDYIDEKIVKKISRKHGFGQIIVYLDNGNYLMEIEKNILANGGLASFAGSAHLFYSLNLVNTDNIGVYHTGQLGDAVMGTYLSKKFQSSYMILRDYIEVIKKNYDTNEKLILYQRGFNGILNGNRVIQHFTEASSPFLYPEFIELTFKIPPNWKKNERIYLEFLKRYIPESYRFPWENLGGFRIGTPSIIIKAHKYVKALRRRLIGEKRLDSMNPMAYWFNNNELLHNRLSMLFEESLRMLQDCKLRVGETPRVMKRTSQMKTMINVITLGKALEIFNISC